jgi:hypothetical protein
MTIGAINLTDVLVPVVYILATVVLAFAFLLLRDLIFNRPPSKEKIAAFARRFEERLLKPDFDGLENYFGHALPKYLRTLYQNRDEILKRDFEVLGNDTGEEKNVWFISYYQPADLENVRDAWPNAKEVFEFANDGSGNGYTVDPRLDDPPVMFFDNESGGRERRVANSFSEFMAMMRRQPKE